MNTKQLRSLESDIEEAGGDTLSALPDLSIQSIAGSSAPPPTRTLQGIEGVLSSRGFNADSGPGSPSGGGEGGGATATAGGEKPASFADYLAAQRSLKKQASIRRRSVPAAVGSDGPEKDGARSPIEPTLGNSNGINDDRGDTYGPPSFNPALLLAASRLKSKATVAKARVAERSASEKRVMHALGTMGQRGSVSDFDWQNAFDELENIDEDGTSDDFFFFSIPRPRALILGCSFYCKGHFAGHGDHGGASLPFYAPPVQRQRWGEDQVLPHVNWVRISFNFSSSRGPSKGSRLSSYFFTAGRSFLRPFLRRHGVQPGCDADVGGERFYLPQGLYLLLRMRELCCCYL